MFKLTTDRGQPLGPCPLRVVSNFVRHSNIVMNNILTIDLI